MAHWTNRSRTSGDSGYDIMAVGFGLRHPDVYLGELKKATRGIRVLHDHGIERGEILDELEAQAKDARDALFLARVMLRGRREKVETLVADHWAKHHPQQRVLP